MRKGMILFLLPSLFSLFGSVRVASQETSGITVKGHELNNGVVILDISKAGKAYELNCNQGYSGCTPLEPGKYVMVELPKNYGMYECRNVEVYPESAAGPEGEKRLGNYCLIEK